MKKFRLLTVLILTFGMLLFEVQPALAVPPTPSSFHGTVKIDGANVAGGTVVSARINGVQYASTIVTTYLGDTVYALDVPGDDDDVPGIQGGVSGDTIVFFIGSIQATQTGTWHSGSSVTLNLTGFTAPGAFSKTSPANVATNVATNPTLSWGISTGATSYEYCYATVTGCTSWTSVGTATSVGLSGLSNSTTYYWQVRAVNGGGNTLADTGTYWSFTTVPPAPGTFNKISPANGATNVATNPTLSWGTSTGATSYEYCYATTNGCTSWTSVGTATSVGLSGLSISTTYYWQVRAVNGGGTTLADSGTYWSFTTTATPPSTYYTLTVIKIGPGVGTVTSTPTGISCGADCSESYEANTSVTLTVTPLLGSVFTGWSGACTGTGICTVIMNADKSVTANFALLFADVPANHWAISWIARLYYAGITNGCGTNPLIYCPESSTTRAEMAKFLEKGMHGSAYTPPPGTGLIFADVPLSYWAVNWIEKLYADGVTIGCQASPLIYCPEDSVSRAQMALYLLRVKHGHDYLPPAAVGIFADVPVTHWAAAWIEELYAEGITNGCSETPLSYCPDNPVKRSEMAKFLVTIFNLP